MDQSVTLPAQTDSQFIAQLPELASELLWLSADFEAALSSESRRLRMTESLRGWGALEKLARQSLIDRGRQAAAQLREQERARSILAAKSQKPFVPSRRLASSMRAKASEALNDPSIVAALVQWSQNPASRKG